MSTLPSIRQRLARSVRWISLLTGLAVAAAVWAVLTHEVHELLDETLQASAQVLAGLLPSQLDAPAWASPPDAGRDFAWQLVGPGGDVRMRSSRAPELPWMPLPTEGLASAGSGWRVYGLRHGEAMLYVAQTHEERLETQAGMALAAAVAAFVVGALGAFMLGRRVAAELRPLDETVRALQVYEPLQPDRPLPAAGRAELVPIHDAVTDLGVRLARRVANERAFSAHAAHALRTPLAGMDAQLAVALREAPAPLVPRLERVRQAAGRLTRVVGALLSLFRSGVELHWSEVDLGPMTARLPAEGVVVQVRSPARVQADPDLLAAAWINLLDNAVRHGARQVDVEVTPTPDGGSCILVEDDGDGADPGRLQALRQALATQQYEGTTGLGLMLADLVARAHGGVVSLPAPARGRPGGFRVELRLGPSPEERST